MFRVALSAFFLFAYSVAPGNASVVDQQVSVTFEAVKVHHECISLDLNFASVDLGFCFDGYASIPFNDAVTGEISFRQITNSPLGFEDADVTCRIGPVHCFPGDYSSNEFFTDLLSASASLGLGVTSGFQFDFITGLGEHIFETDFAATRPLSPFSRGSFDLSNAKLTISVAPVPLTTSMSFYGIGVLGLAYAFSIRKRRQNKRFVGL